MERERKLTSNSKLQTFNYFFIRVIRGALHPCTEYQIRY